MMSSNKLRMHSRIQKRIAPPTLCCSLDMFFAYPARIRRAFTRASRSDPKQMDPKEKVTERKREKMIAVEQHPAAVLSKHHVPMIPATVVFNVFSITVEVQYRETNNRKRDNQGTVSSPSVDSCADS